MNETIEVIIDGLLAQKEKLEATIEELNSFEAEYSKDTKIINDRIDALVLKDEEILDKFRQDLDGINEAITALQAVSIDLSPYATLDDVRQAISDIKIPEMPKAIKGDKGEPGKDAEIDYSIVEAQIKEYILTNRDKFKGKDGETPTNEEIQSIVNQWLNENKESLKGEKGDTITPKDGKDGIGIKSITYKNQTIYITLTDDTKKEFKLPTQYVGGGGISATYVHNAINEALSGGGDVQLKNRAEIEGLFKTAYQTSYSEITYNGADISEINLWDTSAKGVLLFTKSLTYVNGNITQIDIIDHLQGKTLTKELVYNNGNIISINKVIV